MLREGKVLIRSRSLRQETPSLPANDKGMCFSSCIVIAPAEPLTDLLLRPGTQAMADACVQLEVSRVWVTPFIPVFVA